jgi:hypothetical protein
VAFLGWRDTAYCAMHSSVGYGRIKSHTLCVGNRTVVGSFDPRGTRFLARTTECRVLRYATSGLEFDLEQGIAVLERTPRVLRAMLDALPPAWSDVTEGPETWSPYVIVGHLIHGERTDWIPRAQIILAQGASRCFAPFDRLAQFRESHGRALTDLLDEFARVRADSLTKLAGWHLTGAQLPLEGEHPVQPRIGVASPSPAPLPELFGQVLPDALRRQAGRALVENRVVIGRRHGWPLGAGARAGNVGVWTVGSPHFFPTSVVAAGSKPCGAWPAPALRLRVPLLAPRCPPNRPAEAAPGHGWRHRRRFQRPARRGVERRKLPQN